MLPLDALSVIGSPLVGIAEIAKETFGVGAAPTPAAAARADVLGAEHRPDAAAGRAAEVGLLWKIDCHERFVSWPRCLSTLGTWNWLIFGFILMALEMLAPGVFMFWLGLAALLVGLVSFVVQPVLADAAPDVCAVFAVAAVPVVAALRAPVERLAE